MSQTLDNTALEHSSTRSGFVALVGLANAGKSTLLNAIVGSKVSIVSAKPQTTRNVIRGISSGEQHQMIFLDTPGMFQRNTNRELSRYLSSGLRSAVKGVDLVVLVVDALVLSRSHKAFEELSALMSRYEVHTPSVIALNKIDLLGRLKLLPLMERLNRLVSESGCENVDIVPISALKKDGIRELEEVLVRKLPEGPFYFPNDSSTDQSEEFFVSEIVREKLFDQLGDELPYSVAVKVEQWEEEDDLVRLSVVIFVERDSQKGIVIGKGGARLKEIGSAARKELEEIFGSRFYLELFVRVEAGWTKSTRGLKRAGFPSVES